VDHLARHHDVDLLILADKDEDIHHIEGPLKRCRSIALINVPLQALTGPARKLKTALRGLLPWGAPLGALHHVLTDAVERDLAALLAQRQYTVVIWATRHFELACRVRRAHPSIRFVIDIVDSPALWWSRNRSAPLWFRRLGAYTKWKWCRLERQVQDVFDASIYISAIDAQFARRARSARVHVVPNGVFLDGAPRESSRPAPSGRTIGFLGDMSYPPNVSAARRLALRILPLVRATLDDVTLLIIGRNPAQTVLDLRNSAVKVTGTVEDIWPYLARVNAFVFPMAEGSGLQNKILEAMYSGVPVVTTTIAAASVGARDGQELMIAEDDDEIAKRVVMLLRGGQSVSALAQCARSFVAREFAWDSILPKYEAIVALSAQRSSR
jgi:polysaccharide biosynthesis protein PslH